MAAQLEISSHGNEKPLSPAQRKFNRLLKKIEKQKQELHDWKEAQQQIQKQAAQELLPKYAQWHQYLFQQVEQLQHYKQHYKVAKTHLSKLDYLIENLVYMLLHVDTLKPLQYEYLKEIYKDYSQQEIDLPNAAELANEQINEEDILDFQKQMIIDDFAEKFDIDPALIDFDFDPDDPESFVEKFAQILQADQQQKQQEFISQFHSEDQAYFNKMLERDRKKEQKKLDKLKLAQQQAKKSLKSIYLQLTALIHPDREQDEQKKIEKTELMQKVTEAYKQKDLLALLQIQIELDQLNADNIGKLAKQQLELYNLNLEQQSGKIQEEIESIIYSFDWRKTISPYKTKITVSDLKSKYRIELNEVNQFIRLSQNRVELFSSAESIKVFLRHYRIDEDQHFDLYY
ncbi:molecular chaperone DnaJ [Acinetobacter puyangensis]|uniref:DnaJ domain-containing protein n=1 Tax=Acinetobacter puyangensis TaxID=1096779 RepID=A0A240ED93_9GAMM|nr:hypothetical protein [Acinetobacter puyangensis]SNX46139.1 hypothetical protein SAMN05421731_10886 [Acinetobacter puyangensis]